MDWKNKNKNAIKGKKKWTVVPKKPYAYRNPMYKQIFGTYSQNFARGTPQVATVKLNYNTALNLVTAIGGYASYTFRANSVYDPDYTGSGHQPMGFDTWASQYNHYVVLGSKITCKFVNATTGGGIASYVGCQLKSAPTSPHAAVNALLEEDPFGYKITNNAREPLEVVRKYSTKRYHRVTNVNDNIGRLGANVGANPTEEGFYHVWVSPLDNNNQTVNMFIDIRIEYIVQFSEKKPGVFSSL